MSIAPVEHILIVEDSELVADAFRILFEALNRRVSVAGSVAEAIACIEADPPDLVLLDITLPDGSGLEVARRVRDLGQTATLIAMTGHDNHLVIAECKAAGCRDVLIKPVSIHLLRSIIDGTDGG